MSCFCIKYLKKNLQRKIVIIVGRYTLFHFPLINYLFASDAVTSRFVIAKKMVQLMYPHIFVDKNFLFLISDSNIFFLHSLLHDQNIF